MDKELRGKLRNVVTECRRIIEVSLFELLQGKYGIYKDGTVEDESHMSHLNEEEREYRTQLIVHIEHIQAIGFKPCDAVEQIVREVAFTHLNRICSYKMLEERKYIRESVSRGLDSNGFKRYIADNPDEEKLWLNGQQDIAYRHFLTWIGSNLSDEIGVLFSTNDPANRLFPPQRILDQILLLINQEDLKQIWQQDETVGWIYQYFTPKELRDKARKESPVPRNSYELSFRNQFYTPRYVVQFLTDNTLGRIWYEMRQGKTSLREICCYLVKAENEVFLNKDEILPHDFLKAPQEEIINHTRYIVYRKKKDPRDIKILDPACGSGHFLLYCFDLLEVIYKEAYQDLDSAIFSETGKKLREDFPDENLFFIAIPNLILKYNLHGVDIDLRATQIASLGLWLKVQKTYQLIGLSNGSRPKITRMNIVCAEPMPGEKEILNEFIKDLKPNVLGDLIRVIFNKMQIVSDVGSLLKIDSELIDTIATAKQQWLTRPKSEQLTLFPTNKQYQWNQSAIFDIRGISDYTFWQDAEEKVIEALKNYSAQTANESDLRIKLFAEDAARGFAFVEVYQKSYDVILMNPPFGAPSTKSKEYIDNNYPLTKNDVYAAFVERGLEKLVNRGMIGAITSRTGFFLKAFEEWREQILLKQSNPLLIADLGHGVLDTAMVETAAYTIEKNKDKYPILIVYRLLSEDDNKKGEVLKNSINKYNKNIVKITNTNSFSLVPTSPFSYWISDDLRKKFIEFLPFEKNYGEVRKGLGTCDDFRFLRLKWEVPVESINCICVSGFNESNVDSLVEQFITQTNSKKWSYLLKGGEYSPFYSDVHLVVNWQNNGSEIRSFYTDDGKLKSRPQNRQYYFRPGLTWTRRTTSRFSIRILPLGVIFSDLSNIILPYNTNNNFTYMALFSSNVYYALMKLSLGADDAAARTYDIGIIQRLPVPKIEEKYSIKLCEMAYNATILKIGSLTYNETSCNFTVPLLLRIRKNTLVEVIDENQKWAKEIEDKLIAYQEKADLLSYDLYNVTEEDREEIEKTIDVRPSPINDIWVNNFESTSDLLSYIIGCTYGRWDIRLALEKNRSKLIIDPFSPIPSCPIGMLCDDKGLPLNTSPDNYPIEISWDGILVDDEGHPSDII